MGSNPARGANSRLIVNTIMKNFTEDQKEALQELVEEGAQVSFVAYNPNTVDGDPEQDAEDAGWFEYYREDTDNLVEVIYLDEEPPEEE